MQELIAYAKANPGKINYASQGIGTTSHTTAELFQTITHTKLVHVPYKGTAPAVADLLAGNVDLMFNELATSIELHKGRPRANSRRHDQTARRRRCRTFRRSTKSGVPGCISDTWHALTAPPKTPAAVVAKLNAAANNAMAARVLIAYATQHHSRRRHAGRGRAFIKDETKRWGEVIHDAGIKPE